MICLKRAFCAIVLCAGFSLHTAAPVLAQAAQDPLGEALLGEFALQSGDPAAAARHYLSAAQASNDVAVAERAAQAAMLAEDDDLLGLALQRWAQLDGEAHGLLATQAMLALRRREDTAATAALAGLLGRQDEDAIRLALQVLSGSSDPGHAASILERLLDQQALPADFQAWLAFGGLAQRWRQEALTSRIVAEAVTRFPDEPRAWLLQAARLREQGNDEAARAAIARALAADAGDVGLRVAAAGELERLGDPSAAAAALAGGPQDDMLYSTRAAYLAQAGDSAGLAALHAELTRSVVEAGQGAEPEALAGRRLLLGQISEFLEQPGTALEWYQSIEEGPVQAQAQLRIARVLAAEDRLDEALQALRGLQLEVYADGEMIRDAYLYEAELLTRAGMEVEALVAYGRGLGIFEDDPALLYARALLWERMDRIAAAEEDLRRILAFDPDNPAVLNALGYTLADRTERFDEALGYIEQALAQDPDNPAIIDSMGWVLYRLGRIEDALEHLQRAWALHPDPEIGAHLGEVLWVSGRRRQARAVWREALRLDPGNPVLERTMERLL